MECSVSSIQADLFKRAEGRMKESTRDCDDFDEYKKSVKGGGFYRVHWCGEDGCETRLQERTKSTIRCIPFNVEEEDGACLMCGKPSKRRVIAAQAY